MDCPSPLQSNRSHEKKRYWVRMNNKFFSTASCCSSNIVGCYAPNGDHAEKPLEIALKSNVVMISLFEESREKGKKGESSNPAGGIFFFSC